MDQYYKEQLDLLHKSAAEFARKNPAIAPMLAVQGGDPDVERILEGTAYLCGQLRSRLEQTAPRLVEALLNMIAPYAVMPLPSIALVQFSVAPDFQRPVLLEEGTTISSVPIDGTSCVYSVLVEKKVLPLTIESVTTELGTVAKRVSMHVSCPAHLVDVLEPTLSLHLAGYYPAASQRMHALVNKLDSVELRTASSSVTLPASAVTAQESHFIDSRLPDSKRNNRGYVRLLDYFQQPEQLLFVTLSGLDSLHPSETDDWFDIIFTFRPGEDEEIPDFSLGNILFNVVPVVNIFRIPANPILVTHLWEEYQVHPRSGTGDFTEIIGIDRASVLMADGRTEACLPYMMNGPRSEGLLYTTRIMPRDDKLSDLYVVPFYDKTGIYKGFPVEKLTLSLQLLCCNHTLPSRLRVGDICRSTDSTPPNVTFSNITTPSPMIPRPVDETYMWQAVGGLSINMLGLSSASLLKYLISLLMPALEWENMSANRARRDAILEFSSIPEEKIVHGRLLRGRLLTLTIDPAGFASEGDMYLFANSLNNVFCLYSELNTYTRLILKNAATGDITKWKPQLGFLRMM